MDFTLSPEIEDLRLRTRDFIESKCCRWKPIRKTFPSTKTFRTSGSRRSGESQTGRVVGAAIAETIRRHGAADRGLDRHSRGGGTLDIRPAGYQLLGARRRQHESARARGTPAQKEWWLRPIVEGKVSSSFAMTEPAPGGGSDPGMIRTCAEKNGKWVIHGRKWFITGADDARISSSSPALQTISAAG